MSKITSKYWQQPVGIMVTLAMFVLAIVPANTGAMDAKSSEAAIAEMKEVFGVNRVLVGKQGFDSLTAPHSVP